MQCKYALRGRGTFGLENSSGVKDKEQPIFSLPHQVESQGPAPSPHDNRAKLCQVATIKDRRAGDSEIFIKPWMSFRHMMKEATGHRGRWLLEQLI